MRPEYTFDYTTAVRGKYYKRLLKEGANVAVVEPDVAEAFRDSASVNATLRSLLEVSEATRRHHSSKAKFTQIYFCVNMPEMWNLEDGGSVLIRT
ncbi:MAG: uncharacterized protein K0S45_2088 [Nitrospira sp.]|jgi:hypothetical protein|nr:uncharacterized protein [Nitrospira sp.]